MFIGIMDFAKDKAGGSLKAPVDYAKDRYGAVKNISLHHLQV